MVTRYTQPAYNIPTMNMQPGTAIGFLLGQALAGNVERSRVKGLTDYIASQSKTFMDPAQITDVDTQAAQAEYAKQQGFSSLLGKDGYQSLADQQNLWNTLDGQKQQLLAKGDAMTDEDKVALNAIGQKQNLVHKTAEAIRTVLQGKGVDITGYGANDEAQTSFLNKLGVFRQTQNQNSVAGSLENWISSQSAQTTQSDIPRARQGQPLPTVGVGHATVQTDQDTGRIDVNRTSILPPSQKVTTNDILKAAQQPNSTLSFSDFAGQEASPTVTALAKQLAQQRADASFQPTNFLSEVQRKAAQAGLNDEDYNRIMAQATSLVGAKVDQLKQAKNQVLIQNLVQQMQGAGNTTGAALLQYLTANGIKAGDLAQHFPAGKYVNVDSGGTIQRMPEQGAGWGSTLGLQKTIEPNTLFNGEVSVTNNQNTNATNERNNIRTNATSAENNIRTNTTSVNNNIRSNNTTLAGKQMELRDKDKSLEAAKIALQNYNDFEKARLSKNDDRPNPYEDSVAQAQQIVNGKMGVVDSATLKLQSAINDVYQQNGGDRAATFQWIDAHAAEIKNAGLDVGLAKSWVS